MLVPDRCLVLTVIREDLTMVNRWFNLIDAASSDGYTDITPAKEDNRIFKSRYNLIPYEKLDVLT